MGNTKDFVSVGKPKIGGAVFRAPSGTAVPTNATSALDTSVYKCLGYVSADRMKNSISKTVENIKAWGGTTVITSQTEKNDTFDMTFIESLNADVLKTAHGDSNVTGSLDAEGGLVVTVDGSDDEDHVYVIDQELQGGVKMRTVIPCAKVTAIGEIIYKDDQAISYPITLTAQPDASENYHYEYRIGATGATGATGETGE